jgi:hypothetical protein
MEMDPGTAPIEPIDPNVTAVLKVGDVQYLVPRANIPPKSALYLMLYPPFGTSKEIGVLDIEEEEGTKAAVEAIARYLLYNEFPPLEYREVLSYFGLDPRVSYEQSIFHEDMMRKNMYMEGFAGHPMNTNPHYGLIKLTAEMWDSIVVNRPPDSNLLFSDKTLEKSSWDDIQQSLKQLTPIFSVTNVFVAGGRIVSALFGTKSKDIDMFFYDVETNQTESMIFELMDAIGYTDEEVQNLVEWKRLGRHDPKYNEYIERYFTYADLRGNMIDNGIYKWTEVERLSIAKKLGLEVRGNHVLDVNEVFKYQGVIKPGDTLIRTRNSLSFGPYQVILRMYRSPSEILQGFDVDCCCVGYDGKDIWLTQRALYSFCNGLNTINFDRMSPSYEWRLAKYGTRGFAIYIPNFVRTKVDADKMDERQVIDKKYRDSVAQSRQLTSANNPNLSDIHHKITQYTRHQSSTRTRTTLPKRPTEPLKGLDILLYLEYLTMVSKTRDKAYKRIESLSELFSDYAHYIRTTNSYYSNMNSEIIGLFLETIRDTSYEYPELAAKFMPLLNAFSDEENLYELEKLRGLTINKILIDGKITRIGSILQDDIKENLLRILYIDPQLYELLGVIRPWDVPQSIEWKTINPGEQMTGTFHKTVLSNRLLWYNNTFYHM